MWNVPAANWANDPDVNGLVPIVTCMQSSSCWKVMFHLIMNVLSTSNGSDVMWKQHVLHWHCVSVRCPCLCGSHPRYQLNAKGHRHGKVLILHEVTTKELVKWGLRGNTSILSLSIRTQFVPKFLPKMKYSYCTKLTIQLEVINCHCATIHFVGLTLIWVNSLPEDKPRIDIQYRVPRMELFCHQLTGLVLCDMVKLPIPAFRWAYRALLGYSIETWCVCELSLFYVPLWPSYSTRLTKTEIQQSRARSFCCAWFITHAQ